MEIKNQTKDLTKNLNFNLSYKILFCLQKFIIHVLIKFDNKINFHVKNVNYLQFILIFFKKSSFYSCNQLIDYTATHRINNNDFQLSLQLLSVLLNTRLSIHYNLKELQPTISIAFLFKSAIWLERELFDMFGIFIYEHVDLRRILTDYGFKEHPLRKDYPLVGYTEYYYSEIFKSIIEYKTKIKFNEKND